MKASVRDMQVKNSLKPRAVNATKKPADAWEDLLNYENLHFNFPNLKGIGSQ